MKRIKMHFYKTSFLTISLNNFVPAISYSKNVQGYFFTQIWTITFLRYAITLRMVLVNDTNVERLVSHDRNVEKYMV